MLRGMTAKQFDEWAAYAEVEPWEEERMDARVASVVQAILATEKRGRRARNTVPELQACMLKFGSSKPQGIPPARTKAEAERRAAQVRRTMDALLSDQKAAKARQQGARR